VADLSNGNFSKVCTLAPNNQQSMCKNDVGSLAGQSVKYEDLEVGNVVVSGNRALVVMTGTTCVGSQCLSNHDPKVATDSGKSFDQAYSLASSTSSTSPFIVPLAKQGATWYVTGF
jgi:hypothetical protein